MSLIASFYLVAATRLEGLVHNAEVTVEKRLFSKSVTDNYWAYLENNATALRRFDGPGYIYGNLLVYFEEEKGIDLTTNEYDAIAKELIDKRGSAHFLFTNKQRVTFINQLDPDKHSLEEVQQFNKEFSEEGDLETVRLTLEAIQVFHDNLSKVQNDNQVLLLVVA